MVINRLKITGKKGKTVCYLVKDFFVYEADLTVTWNQFRFYTPMGSLKDEEGFNYFEVPSGNLQLERDIELDKTLLLIAETGNSRVLEVLEGAVTEPINMGLEGDIFGVIRIPSDPLEKIVVDYKEVTDGN